MLHKPKSRKAAILKYGLTAPLFALMVILSSATLSRQKVEKVADLSSNKIFLPVVEDTMIALQTLPSNNISEPASAPKADLKDAGLSKEFNLVDTSTIFGSASVDALPEYPGGMEQFYKWIGSNYKFPKQAIEKGVSGRLVVEFVVEKNGRLTSIKPLKGLGHGTVEEAVRLLHSSKAWKPGIKNGKTVRVTYILPIQLNQPITIDPQSVSINGTGTGNNAYFLNGEIISKEDFHKLDPKTIQSLEVTKDKSQFGDHLVPKGTDGIVLIKTK
jgi:TonB family protein